MGCRIAHRTLQTQNIYHTYNSELIKYYTKIMIGCYQAALCNAAQAGRRRAHAEVVAVPRGKRSYCERIHNHEVIESIVWASKKMVPIPACN